MDCFASLAMTEKTTPTQTPLAMTEKGFSIKVDSRIKHTFYHRKPRYLYGLLKKLRFAALVPLARNDSSFSVIASLALARRGDPFIAST